MRADDAAATAAADSFWLEGAVQSLATILSRHVVPLFSEDRRGGPEPRGSGFLVSSGDSSFLVSAAHVFDFHPRLFFYVDPKTQR